MPSNFRALATSFVVLCTAHSQTSHRLHFTLESPKPYWHISELLSNWFIICNHNTAFLAKLAKNGGRHQITALTVSELRSHPRVRATSGSTIEPRVFLPAIIMPERTKQDSASPRSRSQSAERPSKRTRYISFRPTSPRPDHDQPEQGGSGQHEPKSRSGSPQTRESEHEHEKQKPKRGRKPSSCAECRRCVKPQLAFLPGLP